MIIIKDKRKCSGCKACANICPVNAISFCNDDEGCWYPCIDEKTCIECGRCERVCPFNDIQHSIPERIATYSVKYFAAQLKDTSTLNNVSSGGAFQAFAYEIIRHGGVVYGVAQNDVDHIAHIRATNPEELTKTRRSKYLQSDVGFCYKLAQIDLKEGKRVLFSGTGCQIAGLNCYLGKTYENLVTCEVVCHGVPSNIIWEKYRKEKEDHEGKKIIDLVFRDKSKGWNNNQYKITYDDGSEEYERSTVQLFHAGYLQGLFYRPSCGSCPFASIPREADITLADYWQYQGKLKEKNLGVSLVAINSRQGMDLLESSKESLFVETTSEENALASCRHMDEHPVENPCRNAFIKKTIRDGYYAAAETYIHIQSESFIGKVKKHLIRHLRR